MYDFGENGDVNDNKIDEENISETESSEDSSKDFYDLEDFEADLAETSKDADAVAFTYVVSILSENKMNNGDSHFNFENHEIDFTITDNQLKIKLDSDSSPSFQSANHKLDLVGK